MLTAFFIIKQNNHKIPCNFTGTVVAALEKKTAVYVDIQMPIKLTHQQRRNNVRIPIKTADIPNFRLWTGKTIFEESNENSITWRPILRESFEVIDISAGGMMLNILQDSSLAPKVRKNFTLLCTGNFYNPQKEEQNFALLAKICRVILNEKGTWMTIGLQFHKWARITDTQTEWITVDDAGVSFLGTWLAPFKVRDSKAAKE